MAKKKTKRKSTAKRDPETVERNKRIAIGASLAVLAGAVFVGGAMGVGELDRAAADAVVSGTPEISINWPTLSNGTVWLPQAEQNNLHTSIMRSIKGGKALSSDPLREAVRTLQLSGWIDGTPVARWTSEGYIDIHAVWRVPCAVVRVGTREMLIDWNRRVLPLDYAIDESNQRYFINADSPLPQIGQQWVGTDIEDGIGLLRELRANQLLDQVDGFDLGIGAESGTITIITNRGTRVVWGAGPGRERPGEQPASVKIERLRQIYQRAGLLDAGAAFLDIRGDEIMYDPHPG